MLRKRYPPAKYFCVLLIVAGVALFLYKPKRAAGSDEHVFGYGELLLVSPQQGQGGAAAAQIRPCPLDLERVHEVMWKRVRRRPLGLRGVLQSHG